jgi:ATP-dependent DNA helicase RecQ
MNTQYEPNHETNQSWQEQLIQELNISFLQPYQELVIFHLLQALNLLPRTEDTHANLIALFPTGMGKSLCFMGPILKLQGFSLVIYPLNALLNDQERRFNQLGIPCVVLKGGQTNKERRSLGEYMKQQTKGVFLTNPETLVADSMKSFWTQFTFQLMVIDEVHLVIEWGTTFRPHFLALNKFRSSQNIPVLAAFSATVPEHTQTQLKEKLFANQHVFTIQAPMDRSNIEFTVIPTTRPELFAPWWFTPWALCFGFQPIDLPAIFFTPTRADAEKLRLKLQLFFRRLKIHHGICPVQEKDILFYHGGLSKEERKNLEQEFFGSTNGIMVATCAYGTGVDKSNIRSVIHLSPPNNPENYIQESGRAGRDGGPAKALLFFNPEHIKETWVNSYAQPGICRRAWLTSYLGDSLEGCAGCDSCLHKTYDLRIEDLMVIQLPNKERSILNPLKKEMLRTVSEKTLSQWKLEAKRRGYK